MEFGEQVVIITGAARGVGKETAIEFSKQGAKVVIIDILGEELNAVKQVIEKTGNEALAIKIDVSDKENVAEAVQTAVKTFGKIDILVNNAGISGPTVPITKLSENDWDKLFDVNLKSVFFFSKSVIPTMIENNKGCIVNVASIAGKEGNEYLGAYSASKAGVICLSRVIAKELALSNIRVNCIAPALINTEMIKEGAANAPEGLLDKLISKIPMGRLGEPKEVTALILFLASDLASFINGQCINVTGGRGDY